MPVYGEPIGQVSPLDGEKAIEFLAENLMTNEGRACWYSRTSFAPSSVVMIPSRRLLLDSSGMVVVTHEDLDWIVRVADLGTYFPPRPADQIQLQGSQEEYIVVKNDMDNCFEFVDPLRKIIRIHTKRKTP